jgi:MFS transporter, DHA1 family, multidrug resistance protein
MKYELSKSKKNTAIVVIVYLCVVAQFAVDCYIPSLPYIAKSLQVANSSVQLSLSLFLLGAVPAQFIFGTLSDSFGRRPLNILGVTIFILSSLLCLFAFSINMFLCGRLLQGFGIGSGFVLAWAVSRDMFSGKEFTKLISIIVALTILIPVISPIAGGYIQTYLGWRYTFGLLFAMGVVLLIVMLALFPETLPEKYKQDLNFINIYNSYKTLLVNRVFLTNALCASFATAAVIIYITITPFLYQNILHLSPIVFSWVTALVAIGMAIGCIVNSKLVEKVDRVKLISLGVWFMVVGVVLMLIFALLNVVNLYVILFPMLVITLSLGFIVPNVSSRGMEPFGNLAGTASALYSGMQMLIFSLISAIASGFHTENQKPLAFILVILLAIVIFLFYMSKQAADRSVKI